MSKQFTRRGLMKTGIAASAALFGSNGLAFAAAPEAEGDAVVAGRRSAAACCGDGWFSLASPAFAPGLWLALSPGRCERCHE